jgi:hypothetical protein
MLLIILGLISVAISSASVFFREIPWLMLLIILGLISVANFLLLFFP